MFEKGEKWWILCSRTLALPVFLHLTLRAVMGSSWRIELLISNTLHLLILTHSHTLLHLPQSHCHILEDPEAAGQNQKSNGMSLLRKSVSHFFHTTGFIWLALQMAWLKHSTKPREKQIINKTDEMCRDQTTPNSAVVQSYMEYSALEWHFHSRFSLSRSHNQKEKVWQ